MTKSKRGVPSPALAVATIALVLALAGTGIALPGKHTVSRNDIKKEAVRSNQIGDGKVRPHDLSDQSRMWAEVSSDGNLVTSSFGGVVSDEGNDGVYTVDFNAGNIDTCSSVAQITSFTPGGGIPAGEIATEVAASSTDTLRVGTSNSAGDPAGRGFTVVVFC